MNIYKLFYCYKNRIDLNCLTSDFIINGASKNVFGLRIYPENYREFMNNYYNTFQRYKIQQNIMTDFKFMELIKQQDSLNIEVADIILTNEDELDKSSNESYELLRKALSQNNKHQILYYLDELIGQGSSIFKLYCYVKLENKAEIFNIYRNGTISFTTNPEKINYYTKDYKLFDFMVKGPEVFA